MILIDSAFHPSEISIKVGESVVWRHEGGLVHDVTSQGGERWGGMLMPGGVYRQVFHSAGAYDYYCTLHSTMRGRVLVLAQ